MVAAEPPKRRRRARVRRSRRLPSQMNGVGAAFQPATAAAMEVNPATVARVRQQYVTAGLDAALHRKPPARQYHRRLDGEQEARLAALACSAPPEGHKRWTLRLLADRLVELEVVETVSYETVRQALKQTGSSHG